jgi:hypothetical protein
VLVGAIHHQTRYRRDPSDLYGADAYIEQADLPDGLQTILREGGLPVGGSALPAPEPTFEVPAPEPALEFVREPPAAAPTEAPGADEDSETAEERERALRLARIAVSEMLLYQPEKFEQAARDGNLEQALDREIQEAQALLRQRIREDVREETDFIMDELNRVAAERSAQG